MKKQCNLLLCMLLIPIFTWATSIDVGKFTKQKEIKKAYIVNSDAGIDIKNSYGNVYVTTWDEDKIELNIIIKVSGDNEKWVLKKIDDINVNIEALKSLVSATTSIDNSNYGSNGKNNSFEINYTIKIPKNGGVKINNKYGAIITTDLFSTTTMVCKYGKITLGKLSGNSNTISIDYCSKSSIESVKNATIDADYSGLTINDFGKINLNADYTDLNFGSGSDLKYNCNYTKLSLGNLKSVEGKGDYLSVHLSQISNDLKIETEYSKITVDEIDSKTKTIFIDSGYTAVDLGYDPNFAFNFDVAVKYANFRGDRDFEYNSKQESAFSKSYQGFYKKSGDAKVTIRSEYANVNLNKK